MHTHHTPLLLLALLAGLPSLQACGNAACAGIVVPEDRALDLGRVGVGESESAIIQVQGLCADAPTTVTSSISGEGFAVSPESAAVLGAGVFTVTASPIGEAPMSGTLVLIGEDGVAAEYALSAIGVPWLDEDEDGYAALSVGGDDCDDADPEVNPGATELWYDGVDQDCDGASDFDQDADGADTPEDCDDTDPDIRPGIEDGEDGEDSDCDGMVDEGPLEVDDILITEIMHRPAATDDGVGEWIEIHNRGAVDLQLQDLRMTDADGDGFTIDRFTTVPAGGYAVLGADGRASNNGGAKVDFVYDRRTLPLANEAGTIRLVGAGDRVISALSWSETWNMADGASLQVDPAADEESDLAERGLWCPGTDEMAGGDLGTPSAANTACPRFDADEDGFAIQDGDCDDSRPEVYPGAEEVWGDGLDNDCSGLADEGELTVLREGRLTGRSAPNVEGLGFPDAFSVGDLDDDGRLEVLVGARNGAGYSGAVYLLELDDLGRNVGADDAAFARFEGGSFTNQLGRVGPRSGDVTGDGVDDLTIGGTDARDAEDFAAVVIAGGDTLPSRLGPEEAELTVRGVVASTASAVHGGLDLDGDGVAELILGDIGPNRNTGVVHLFEGGGSGDVQTSDAWRSYTGPSEQAQAGASLGGDDLDDDGYDDLLVSAWADDGQAANAGSVSLIAGGRTVAASGALSDRSTLRFVGETAGTRLGEGAAARVADFDGDGQLDVLLGAPTANRAYIWLDAGDLSGTVSTASADHELEGPGTPDAFGVGLAAADLNGDGAYEAIIGAADDLTATTTLATSPGEVWLFDLVGAPRRLAPMQARGVIRGFTEGDAVGQSLLGLDIDGAGHDDLLIGATGDADGAGSIMWVSF